MRGYRFPPELHRRALLLYRNHLLGGPQIAEIFAAEGLEVHKNTIQRWVREAGVKTRRAGHARSYAMVTSPEYRQAVRMRLTDGAQTGAIVRALWGEWSKTRCALVSSWLRKAGCGRQSAARGVPRPRRSPERERKAA